MAGRSEKFMVAPDEAGSRLDRLLAMRLPEHSRSRHKALIQGGYVALKGATIRDPGQRVNAGDTIAVELPRAVESPITPQRIPLDIVYEDDAILVINKPPGLVVHPAAGNWSGTLVNALIAHCGESLSGIGGEKRPGIVHRLDKNTSGLMVIAKSDRAHRALAAQFADHGRTGALRRGYLAFVWGALDRPSGTITKPIGRHAHARDRMSVRQDGRTAITHWELRERYAGRTETAVASLLECRLETGRTHQVRVHLAAIGHPLLGDKTYGSGFLTKANQLGPAAREEVETLGRQALHAYMLAIKHPLDGRHLEFRSELPDDLIRLRRSLGAQGTPDDRKSLGLPKA
jgi:23S rRNA pseudouridine1911/1915/1917 synthase